MSVVQKINTDKEGEAMDGFPTHNRRSRQVAVPHKPLIDPAGWSTDEMEKLDNWTYKFSESEAAEIMDAVSSMRRSGAPIETISPEKFPLRKLLSGMKDVHLEIRDGRGAVRLRGLPIEELDYDGAMIAYLGLSSYIGSLEPQNKYGHLVGHVKDFTSHGTAAEGRGYNTNVQSSLHIDSTDYVGLLCYNEPKSGGNSRISSSVSIYNRILAERPDLIDVLMGPYYKTRYGEQRPGETPYYRFPVFAFVDGEFSCYGVSKSFLNADKIEGVPPYTDKQREAVDVFVDAAEKCAVDMPFQRGDIQYCNNHVILHARRTFTDAPEEGYRRHMWRLWLNERERPRAIHEDRKERRNRSEYLADAPRNVPMDVAAPVL